MRVLECILQLLRCCSTTAHHHIIHRSSRQACLVHSQRARFSTGFTCIIMSSMGRLAIALCLVLFAGKGQNYGIRYANSFACVDMCMVVHRPRLQQIFQFLSQVVHSTAYSLRCEDDVLRTSYSRCLSLARPSIFDCLASRCN